MASNSSLNFSEPHEVVGYGRVAFPFDRESIRIEILFRPVKKEFPVFLSTTDKPVFKWIGAGDLADVPIGSRWCAGEMIGVSEPARKIAAYLTFKDMVALDPHAGKIDIKRPIKLGHMPCYHLRLQRPDDKLINVWVPVIEMARQLFGTTSHFLIQFFSGLREPTLAPDSAFFSRAMSYHNADTRYVRLHTKRKPEKSEALVAAYVLADPGIQEAHDSMARRLYDAYHERLKRGELPRMTFPFLHAPFHLDFEGRFIELAEFEGKPQHKFLVTRINKIAFDPPFDKVEVRIHNLKQNQNNPPRDGNPAQQVNRGAERNTVVPERPGTARAAVEEVVDGSALEPAHAVEIIYLERESNGGPGRSAIRHGEPNMERQVSPEDRHSDGALDVSHIKFRRAEATLIGGDPSAVEKLESQRATIKAIRWLKDKNRDKNWKILQGGMDDDEVPIFDAAYFGDYSFPIIIMVVSCEFGQFIVADAGTCDGRERSLGLIARGDHGEIKPNFVKDILKFAGEHDGGWQGKTYKGCKLTRVARRPLSVVKENEVYSALIEKGIERLFTSPAGVQTSRRRGS